MKQYTITVDTGTTNTRVILWDKHRKPLASAQSGTGVRITAIEGNNKKLKEEIRHCMDVVLKKQGLTFEDVENIIASGMITSNMGLVEIPHICAPASIKEFADHSQKILLEEVCPIPILFIPGMKNQIEPVTVDNFEGMDMMRGEEVEALAITKEYPAGRPYLLVLPGSHTKFVSVDKTGKITGCLTTITGELLSAITNETLIADAVGHSFASEETYDKEMVLRGFQTAKKTGIGRACFSARILNTFSEPDKQKIANFILGAVLQNDLEAAKNSSALNTMPADTCVIISGKNPLRKALADLFIEDGAFKHVEEFIPDPSFSLSAKGAFLVADLIS